MSGPAWTLSLPSPAATAQWAGHLAAIAEPGLAIGLVGDVGAGKTTFVAAFVAALNATDSASSPTFALIQHYRGGRLRVMHVDLYRISSEAELMATGYWDEVDRADVLLVEWADQCAALPPSHLRIELEHVDGADTVRTARVTAVGPAQSTLSAWQARATEPP